MFRLILILLCALAVPLASAAPSPARPAKSIYLLTEGGGFLMAKGEGLFYAMTFSLRKKLVAPTYARVEFQNPANGDSPFTIDLTLSPGQEILEAQSPAFKRIRNETSYTVTVLLFSDEARTKRLGKHVQKVLFSIPAGAAQGFGIELQ